MMLDVKPLLVAIQLLYLHTDALMQGYVDSWIAKEFCKATYGGMMPIPWDCTGFLRCSYRFGDYVGIWFACPYMTEYDPTMATCSHQPKTPCGNMADIANVWCPRYPKLKFAHPKSCAMYYDCSQKSVLEKYELGVYESECSYPNVFDPKSTNCRPAEKVDCVNKPSSKCSYKTECLSTSSVCEEKPNGLSPKPGTIFTPEFIRCGGGQLIVTGQCKNGEVLDPLTATCTSNIEFAVEAFCATENNRFAKFADPTHCARYYDCTTKIHHFGLQNYQSECKYMFLFEPKSMSCVSYDQLLTPCGNRFEPKEPCSYKVGHCMERVFCIDCAASCLGKPDGPNSYPTYPNTRFHLACKDERTKNILECRIPNHIFSDRNRACIPDGTVITTAKTTTTTTTTTTTATTTTTTTTKPTTTTVTTMKTTIATTTKAPVQPDVCTCIEEFQLVLDGLQNLTSHVNSLELARQVTGPYSCDRPESKANSDVTIQYKPNQAVATYTCKNGYSFCRRINNVLSVSGQMKCDNDNTWVDSPGDCVKTTWTEVQDHIDIPCPVVPNTVITVRGRAVQDTYFIRLDNPDLGKGYLDVGVYPSTGKIVVNNETIDSPVSLNGEHTMTLHIQADQYQIFFNDEHVLNVPHSYKLQLQNINRIEKTSGLFVEEVKYHPVGFPALSVNKRPLAINLAYKMHTYASSQYQSVPPDMAIDGYSYTKWEDKSCWQSLASDSKPWWMLVLDNTIYVTHVVLIGGECVTQCGDRDLERTISIEMFDENPTVNVTAIAQVCIDEKTLKLVGTPIELKCDSFVTGRYLRINSKISQKLTLCEVEVYGEVTDDKEWTTFSCPDPPLMDDTSVTLSYTKTKAMATYTCNGTDIICPGDDIIYCFNEEGWTSKPGSCRKTVLEAPIRERLQEVPICPLALGTVIELWATPAENKGSLLFHDKDDDIFRLEHTLDKDVAVTLYHMMGGVVDDVDFLTTVPFVLQQEAHIVISILTDYMLIEVDDEVLYKYPVKNLNVHKTISLIPSDGFVIRRALIHPNMMPDIYKERVEDNLAFKAAVSSSSAQGNPASFGVNGYPEPTGLGSCWNADVADRDQWYQVDLGKQYFVREIKIDITDTCSNCEKNLHDVSVFVYTGDPQTDRDLSGKLCTSFQDDFPKDIIRTLSCKESVWGRYIRIATEDIQHRNDQMTLCEVEVYGDKAVKRRWTPLDCPLPPLLENMRSGVEYGRHEAIATVHCLDGFSMCNEPKTIKCTRNDGWTGGPGKCLPTSFSSKEDKDITSSTFCPLRVGDAMEIFFTPEQEMSRFALAEKTDNGDVTTIVQVDLDEQFEEAVVELPQEGKKHYYGGLHIKLKEEQRILVTFLSDHLEFDFDGVKYFTKVESPHRINHYQVSEVKAGSTRKVTILSAGVVPTINVPHPDDVAQSRTATSSSALTAENKPSLLVAEDNTMMSCWMSGLNDLNPWWQVDLIHYYYVSKVKITNKDKSLRNFVIELFHGAPDSGERGQLCLRHDRVFPPGTTNMMICTEKVAGRILRITAAKRTGEIQDVLEICKLAVYGGRIVTSGYTDDTRNIALFRPATASTQYNTTDLTLPAGLALDGNRNVMLFGKSCWMASEGDLNPWWEVDLQHFYFISHFIITSRKCPDKCNFFLHDFIIEVFPDNLRSQQDLCVKYEGAIPGGNTEIVKCQKRVFGRYARIRGLPRKDDKDVLTMCEVSIHGGIATTEEPSPTNLAQSRPVTSSTRNSPPGRVVDGNKATTLLGASCWLSATADRDPWLMVELDAIYSVSQVVITNIEDCGPDCKDRLHDFQVEVFLNEPQEQDAGVLCFSYAGIFPQGVTKAKKCDTDKALGRFVRLSSFGRTEDADTLTLCEFEVYGAKVKDAWTPSSCPEPPKIENACLDVCYSVDRAVATYTCNANYSMCTGSNVLYCTGEAGWVGKPGTCMQTTMQLHYGHVGLKQFPICYPKLGEGIELWIIPEESGASLSLLNDEEGSEALTIVMSDNSTTPVTVKSRHQGNILQIEEPPNLFTLTKMARLKIIFLSEDLLVTVDDEKLLNYPHTTNVPKAYFVTSNDNLLIKMVRPVNRYAEGIDRSDMVVNLAEIKRATSDSHHENFHPRLVTDGDLSQMGDAAKCWYPIKGAEKQWIKINLDYYYFIREVVIYSGGDSIKEPHDFAIDVLPSEVIDDLTMRCAFYEGAMPGGTTERIRCKDDVWGMFVQISNTYVTGEWDVLNFCEIQIYGDSVNTEKHLGCPKTQVANGQIAYSGVNVNDVATLTCDANYKPCGDKITGVCLKTEQWEPLATCEQNRWESLNVPFAVPLPCVSDDAFSISIKMTPTDTASMVYVNLQQADESLLFWAVRFDAFNDKNKTFVNTLLSGAWGNLEYFQKFPFIRGKLATVDIAYKGTPGIYELHVDQVLEYTFNERKSGAKPDKLTIEHDTTVSLVELL